MISVIDAAETYRIERRTLNNICSRGDIKAEKVGNHWWMDEESFAEYFQVILIPAHQPKQQEPHTQLILADLTENQANLAIAGVQSLFKEQLVARQYGDKLGLFANPAGLTVHKAITMATFIQGAVFAMEWRS